MKYLFSKFRISNAVLHPVRRFFCTAAAKCTELDSNQRNLIPQSEPFPGVFQPLYQVQNAKNQSTSITKLANGLKIASEQIPGPIATFGVVIDAGSRYETPAIHGVSHFIDRLSFRSTKHRSQDQMAKSIEELGGNANCTSSRETIIYASSVFKYDVESMFELLADALKNPLFSDQEMQQQKDAILYELKDIYMKPESVLPEIIHYAAYKSNTLGYPLICPESYVAPKTSRELFDFMKCRYVGPKMVVAATGVDHDLLVKLSEKHFGSLPAHPPPLSICNEDAAVYTGGEVRLDGNFPLAHVSLAFEGVGWAHQDLYAVAVLQMLMGGGGSFSAGGPGKGMYSRLFTNVLNRYHWVESMNAYNSCYKDSGIFGMYGTCVAKRVPELVNVMCQEFTKMTKTVDTVELERAKNQLKSSVLMNLESRLIHFEDIGRQVLATGKRETPAYLCQKIDEVSPQDLSRVATRMLMSPPSVAAYGDLLYLPPTEIIKLHFQ